MKRYIYFALAIVVGIITFSSCSDEENITPSGNYSPIRGEFPQGNSEYDAMIKEISEEYSVYLLYKDITEQDLNREWTSTGTGPVYVAGPEEEREACVWNLPDEQMPFYVNFFYNYIFPNITVEFAHSTFPVKIYMINNLRTEPRDFGDEDEEDADSSEPNVGTDGGSRFVSIKTGNFDNWAISFKDDVVNGADDEYSIRQQRCIFMVNAINNARDRGIITTPSEFWSGYVFSEKDTVIYDKPESDHYNYKLGLLDDIYNHFATSGNTDEVWRPTLVVKHTNYWDGTHSDYDLFAAFLKNAMWLTPDEFEERYPSDKYPMIKEKYDLVVGYMKDTYGIDLVGIAKGLNK